MKNWNFLDLLFFLISFCITCHWSMNHTKLHCLKSSVLNPTDKDLERFSVYLISPCLYCICHTPLHVSVPCKPWQHNKNHGAQVCCTVKKTPLMFKQASKLDWKCVGEAFSGSAKANSNLSLTFQQPELLPAPEEVSDGGRIIPAKRMETFDTTSVSYRNKCVCSAACMHRTLVSCCTWSFLYKRSIHHRLMAVESVGPRLQLFLQRMRKYFNSRNPRCQENAKCHLSICSSALQHKINAVYET